MAYLRWGGSLSVHSAYKHQLQEFRNSQGKLKVINVGGGSHIDGNLLIKSQRWALISSGFSWLIQWAAPSMTTTSCKHGTSLLKPPSCMYSWTPGILQAISSSPTINFTGTLICASVHGAVSSQVLLGEKEKQPCLFVQALPQITHQGFHVRRQKFK